MKESIVNQELDTPKKEETLKEIKSNPENIKKAGQVAANVFNVFGSKWIKHSRFKKQFKGSTRDEFINMIQYLKEFDLAVVKVDRGEIKFKIDFNHETEIELIIEEIKMYQSKTKVLEVRMEKLKELQKNICIKTENL